MKTKRFKKLQKKGESNYQKGHRNSHLRKQRSYPLDAYFHDHCFEHSNINYKKGNNWYQLEDDTYPHR